MGIILSLDICGIISRYTILSLSFMLDDRLFVVKDHA